MAISGLLAFFQPFSILVTGLHALMGFVFMGLIVAHVKQNSIRMGKSLNSKYFLFSLGLVLSLVALFSFQPPFIKSILGLSHNVGAALDRFEMSEDGLIYQYSPAKNFKLKLEVRQGKNYDSQKLPEIAIWLENKSFYHIKTLYTPEEMWGLPYWAWKVEEYEKAKNESAEKEDDEIDGLSSATPNSSFDPKDYILPERNKEPFYLMIEVNQNNDKNEHYEDQPSILYRVEIDNKFPKAFQTLDLQGYSKYEAEEKAWNAYYPDGTLTTSLHIIDSALLTIERESVK